VVGCTLLTCFLPTKKRERRGGTYAFIIVALIFLNFAQASQPGNDAVTYELSLRSPSGAVLPRVRLPDRQAVAVKVNQELEALASRLRCLEGTKHLSPLAYRSRASVTYASNDVLSVSIHAAYDCGGAYPTGDANASVTYDLRTGKRVPFEMLFENYRRDEARIVRALLPALRAAGMAVSKACSRVLTAENLSTYGFAYSLSQVELTVQPDFPHVIAACSQEVTVPYGRLKAFVRADGVLARVTNAERRYVP
jgi:hypothetical protein